jgi:hypothetical protein
MKYSEGEILVLQRNILEVQGRLNIPEFYLLYSTSESRPCYGLFDNFFRHYAVPQCERYIIPVTHFVKFLLSQHSR